MADILTEVITSITNERIHQKYRYGMSIVNLPEIDIKHYVDNLEVESRIELFFFGLRRCCSKEDN